MLSLGPKSRSFHHRLDNYTSGLLNVNKGSENTKPLFTESANRLKFPLKLNVFPVF